MILIAPATYGGQGHEAVGVYVITALVGLVAAPIGGEAAICWVKDEPYSFRRAGVVLGFDECQIVVAPADKWAFVEDDHNWDIGIIDEAYQVSPHT